MKTNECRKEPSSKKPQKVGSSGKVRTYSNGGGYGKACEGGGMGIKKQQNSK